MDGRRRKLSTEFIGQTDDASVQLRFIVIRRFTRMNHKTFSHLREHNNVYKSVQGHLGLHCRDCGCQPDFRGTKVIARHNNHMTCEIIEASEIICLKDQCISMASLALTQKELIPLNL